MVRLLQKLLKSGMKWLYMYRIKAVSDDSFYSFCFVPKSVVMNTTVQQLATKPRGSQ